MNLAIRFRILKRDNFRCVYCGRTSTEARLEIDHAHPLAKGGPDDEDNLVTACYECNRGKRDVLLHAARSLQLKMRLHTSGEHGGQRTGSGRRRVYQSNAERQKAYRQRKNNPSDPLT